MLLAFFESFKYLGHLWPVTLLRVYIGYLFFENAMKQIHAGYLRSPEPIRTLFQHWIDRGCESPFLPAIQQALEPSSHTWMIFGYGFVIIQTIVGICYMLGYLVRPAGVLGIFLASFILLGTSENSVLQKTYVAVHLTLMLLGAGRCLGFDFYFYKRTRGILW